MLSAATKFLLGLSAAALVASISYGVVTDEGSGTATLAFVSAGAFALAMVALAAGPDLTPIPTSDGPSAHNAPAGGRPLFPSVWPIGAGLAVGLLALGSATSWVVVVAGAVTAVAVLLGWLFQAWTEHPAFTSRFGARLSDRLLVPLGMPLAVFSLVAIIALSLSRVLLAVPEQGSRIVAIAVAIVILAGAFFIVSQERMARAALSLLSVLALVAVVAAGVAGLVHGERHFETKAIAASGAPGAAVSISAKDIISFNVDHLEFPADQTVALAFDNQTPAVPHNVAIYDHQGGQNLFRGDLVTGPARVTYKVRPLAAGTYWFQCDVHNNMHGTLTVGATGAGTTAGATSTTIPPTTSTTESVTAGFATTPTTAGP
jgi:plastocyanin